LIVTDEVVHCERSALKCRQMPGVYSFGLKFRR